MPSHESPHNCIANTGSQCNSVIAHAGQAKTFAELLGCCSVHACILTMSDYFFYPFLSPFFFAQHLRGCIHPLALSNLSRRVGQRSGARLIARMDGFLLAGGVINPHAGDDLDSTQRQINA